MRAKRTFRKRLIINFSVVFSIFTLAVLVYQYNREKSYRTGQLENTLNNISEITYQFIEHNNIFKSGNFRSIDSLRNYLPDSNIRITVVDKQGKVLYDSFVKDYLKLENHLKRPEIQKALHSKTGASIRLSASTKQKFYYFARDYDDFFIRAATIYDIKVANFLKTERVFVIFVFFLLALMIILLFFSTRRLGEFITQLKDFALKAGQNEDISQLDSNFPDNELGVIRKQIIQIYANLKKAKDELTAEKEKLYGHLQVLNEGISIFSPEKKKILANSHFIQLISIISDKTTKSAEDVFLLPEISEINKFIDKTLEKGNPPVKNNLPQTECIIEKNEKYFHLRCIVFPDNSFEILISDVTRPEKRRLLKQQLTSNIAHELKTPLSSIIGYLETILNNPKLESEKQKYFLEKAFAQSNRLTDLLNDISLLNNIEDAGNLFEINTLKLKPIINDVIENLKLRLTEKNMQYFVDVKDSVTIKGNESLLFSIFQNLIENSINYAGNNSKIVIKNYLEDDKFYYFKYSDTGTGIPEEHIPRIFERFYRIDYGRARQSGGTGLGLSIVKNAILLHKGEISVKNNPEGGLEFLFSLSKN